MTAGLCIRGLRVEAGAHALVDGVDLDVAERSIQGLAGESGSGKTMTALAALGLTPPNCRVSGSIRVGQTEVVGMRPSVARQLRGRQVAMVFQDPVASLHPQISVGEQLCDHVRTHLRVSRRAARQRAAALLDEVRVPEPVAALARYPHQFSGGQRQRIAIASALACDPTVLLADEPTTALDVTVQAGIMHLLARLAADRDLAVLLVTHDLGVLSALADRVAVMRSGKIVESGTREQIFNAPRHEYTKQLLSSLPQMPDD